MALQNKLSAKEFIPSHVRCTEKLRENLNVGFLHTDRPIGFITILKHEEVAEEGLRTVKACFFSESSPEIKGTAYRLFSPIIEIVAKGGSDLGFGFDRGDQFPFTDNEEIPFFGRSEEARKFNSLFSKNAATGNSGMYNKFCKKIDEPIHLCTAGDGAAETLIRLTP